MSLTVILAVGLDEWQLAMQSSAWRGAGYIPITARSVRDAIELFRSGDFDLVMLGDSLSVDDEERLTRLIRATGAKTPILRIGNFSGDRTSYAVPTLQSDLSSVFAGIEDLMMRSAEFQARPNIPYQ
jgi:DNA-binding response OmpR family regulator